MAEGILPTWSLWTYYVHDDFQRSHTSTSTAVASHHNCYPRLFSFVFGVFQVRFVIYVVNLLNAIFLLWNRFYSREVLAPRQTLL